MHWLRVLWSTTVPLSVSERQRGVLGAVRCTFIHGANVRQVLPALSVKDFLGGLLTLSALAEAVALVHAGISSSVMAITLKRQLDDGEKQKILEQHGRVCFATGHPIGDDEVLHFDHILAFTKDGASELDNIAPMCEVPPAWN